MSEYISVFWKDTFVHITKDKRIGFHMTNSNDFSPARLAKAVMGSLCDVTVTGTFNLYSKKRKLGVLNMGRAVIGDKEQKVFVIGLNGPVKNYSGQIIALAVNDRENELVWICAPEGSIYYEPKLCQMLEKYLPCDDYRYICFYEKSCGAVMYTQSEGERKFILITNISGHIGFPKGHIERGENEKMTALREVYEETGVKTRLIEGFRESYHYLINGFIHKKAVYYLAKFDEADVKMNIREISEYMVLTYQEAMKILGFKHDKDILTHANEFADKIEKGNV